MVQHDGMHLKEANRIQFVRLSESVRMVAAIRRCGEDCRGSSDKLFYHSSGILNGGIRVVVGGKFQFTPHNCWYPIIVTHASSIWMLESLYPPVSKSTVCYRGFHIAQPRSPAMVFTLHNHGLRPLSALCAIMGGDHGCAGCTIMVGDHGLHCTQ